MFVVDAADGHKAGIAGSYKADPKAAMTVAVDAMQSLYKYEARRRLEPMPFDMKEGA